MNYPWIAAAITAGMLLHACSDNGRTITGPGTVRRSTDPNGVVWNIEYGKLTGYDLARDSVVAENGAFVESFDAASIVAGGTMLFIGLRDGKLLPVDVSDHGNLRTKPQVRISAEVNGTIDRLCLGEDVLWAIEQSPALGVRCARFSADGTRLLDTLRLGDPGGKAHGLTVHDGDAWVLVGNPFMLLKIGRAAVEVVDTVALGRDPADASVRGPFAGGGPLARVRATAWVADNTTRALVKIDLSTAAIDREFDLTSLLSGSETQLLASDWGVFVSDGMSAAKTMHKIDPADGSVSASYTVDDTEGIFHSKVKHQRLLINVGGGNGMNNIVELDTQTMTRLHETGFEIYSRLMAIE